MTRSEFSRKVASRMHTTPTEAKKWVTAVFDVLTEQIMVQDKVILMNFGTFERKIRVATRRLDWKQKKIVDQKAVTIVKFAPATFLAEKIAKEAPLEVENENEGK